MKGLDVRRRLRIPMRFLVGLRPAGAESGLDFERLVSSLGAGERAGRIGRRDVTVGLREEKSWGEGGARVRKKFVGFTRVSLLEPSGHLERLGERKIIGSMFSLLSSSNVVAFRLLGGDNVLAMARGDNVRFMMIGQLGRSLSFGGAYHSDDS